MSRVPSPVPRVKTFAKLDQTPDIHPPAMVAHAGAKDLPPAHGKRDVMVPSGRPTHATFGTADADMAPAKVNNVNGRMAVGAWRELQRHHPRQVPKQRNKRKNPTRGKPVPSSPWKKRSKAMQLQPKRMSRRPRIMVPASPFARPAQRLHASTGCTFPCSSTGTGSTGCG